MKPSDVVARLLERLHWILVGIGLLSAALAVLEPPRRGTVGAAVALAGLLLGALRGRVRPGIVVACVLAGAFAVATWAEPEMDRADSLSYYVYLRSATFDRDLDFTNEYERLGAKPPPLTSEGRPGNNQSIGPAVFWSPFFLAAHAYVLVEHALGDTRHAADGYSRPYRRSVVLGTITTAVLGAGFLTRLMTRSGGRLTALLSVVGTLIGSPVIYYIFVVPGMAHALTYGVAAALLWAWDRARRTPSLQAWVALGGLLGLLALLRWQAAAYVILVAPLAIQGLLRRTVPPSRIVAAVGAAFVGFSPQCLAWKALYGRYVTIPQGGGFMDWSAPHLLDTLIAADHGLFAWTPAALLGTAGLFLTVRRSPLLAAGALGVILATAWVNGGVLDWAASDAFGARRFDLVVPLITLGVGASLDLAVTVQARSPLLAPGCVLGLLALWNLGLIGAFRQGRYPHAAPLERVASDEVRALRLVLQRLARALAGPWGRGFVYKYLNGEYVYTDVYRDGVIRLASLEDRETAGGWSNRRKEARGEASFRWALAPESCLRLPLEEPAVLRLTIKARAPARLQPQIMTVLANQREIGTATLGTEWAEVPVLVPQESLIPGENALCLRFSRRDPATIEGGRVCAAVAWVKVRGAN